MSAILDCRRCQAVKDTTKMANEIVDESTRQEEGDLFNDFTLLTPRAVTKHQGDDLRSD